MPSDFYPPPFPFDQISEVRREASECLFGHPANVQLSVTNGMPMVELDLLRLHMAGEGASLRDGSIVRFTGRWLHIISYKYRALATAESMHHQGLVVVPAFDLTSPVPLARAIEEVSSVDTWHLSVPYLGLHAVWGVHWGVEGSRIDVLPSSTQERETLTENEFIEWLRWKTQLDLPKASQDTN